MKVPLKDEIYALEKLCAETYGMPTLLLMENAGAAASRFILENVAGAADGKFMVFCGNGNNGGDGAVVARKLYLERPGRVTVVLMNGGKETFSGITNASVNFGILKRYGVPVLYADKKNDRLKITREIARCDVIVDAVYGIGFRPGKKGKKTGQVNDWIDRINRSGKKIVSIDIPSGVLADGGISHPVRAGYTVSFAFPKLGTIDYPGREYTGVRAVLPIDLPPEIMSAPKVHRELITPFSAKGLVIKRNPDSHKGNYGHLLLIGGASSEGKTQSMAGAVILAGMAALRSGAGLLTVAAPADIVPVIQKDLPECMTVSLCGNNAIDLPALKELIEAKKIKTVLIGNGFGTGGRQKETLEFILKLEQVGKLIVDADGLNNIAESPALVKSLAAAYRTGKEIIVTPHVKEMSRLVKESVEEIKKEKEKSAAAFSAKNRLVTVLKDAVTFISSGDGNIRINETGSAALAKGGSGDVLAGIIAGLVSSGYGGFDAASLGCYLLGRAGEMYSSKYGDESALSRDIVGFIPDCFKELHG